MIKEKTINNNLSGIYYIENLISGKKYIGQSINTSIRWKNHKNQLRGNRSPFVDLQNDWNIFGEENFKFQLIEECNNQYSLDLLEEYYVDFFDSYKNGYNQSHNGKFTFDGMKHKEESKEILRQLHLGKRPSEESIQKNREAHLGENNHFWGKKHTVETRIKMSKNHADVNGENNPAWGNPYAQGIKKSNENFTSQYVGVRKRKGNTWQARIQYKGKSIHIGSFKFETEAALAYNEKALELFGTNAKINIIE